MATKVGREAQSRGGKKAAANMTREQRVARAKKAVAAREIRKIPQALHGSPDKPLKIGDIEIPCYVLDDRTRVLTQRGMLAALGLSIGGGTGGERKLAQFGASLVKKGLDAGELVASANSPIKFAAIYDGTPREAFGYEATLLVDLCEVVLSARDQGLLHYTQEKLAQRCDLLIRGFARVGIIALIDEVTGYQKFRVREALAEVMSRYVSEDLLDWTRTFPDEFYEEIFRLRGWEYDPTKWTKPGVVGRWTNDIIYSRLAPGVLNELRRLTPKFPSGQRKHTYHQRLTKDVGHPALRQHFHDAILLMRAARTWKEAMELLDRVKPSFEDEDAPEFAEALDAADNKEK